MKINIKKEEIYVKTVTTLIEINIIMKIKRKYKLLNL